MWKFAMGYKKVIMNNLGFSVYGVVMYKLCIKLKRLKKVFRAVNDSQFADIEKEERTSYENIKGCQYVMYNSVHKDLVNKELEVMRE